MPHQCAHWFAMTCRRQRRVCGCKAVGRNDMLKVVTRLRLQGGLARGVRKNLPRGCKGKGAIFIPWVQKKHRSKASFAPAMAGDEGFEPPQTESESGVLPLHKSPMWCTQAEQRLLLYAETAECQEEISDFPRNFFFWRSLRSVSKPDIVWSKKGGFILCIMEPYSRDHS